MYNSFKVKNSIIDKTQNADQLQAWKQAVVRLRRLQIPSTPFSPPSLLHPLVRSEHEGVRQKKVIFRRQSKAKKLSLINLGVWSVDVFVFFARRDLNVVLTKS